MLALFAVHSALHSFALFTFPARVLVAAVRGPGAGEAGGALARSRFMAIGGIVFSVSFCLIILAQAIPEVMLGACE